MIIFMWALFLYFAIIPGSIIGFLIGSYLKRGIRIVTCLVISIAVSPLVSIILDYITHNQAVNLKDAPYVFEWRRHSESFLMFQPPIFVSLLIGYAAGAFIRWIGEKGR